MSTYARGTQVPVERSEAEIRKLLVKYGADRFSSGWDESHAFVSFTIKRRAVRFILKLPNRREARFTKGNRGRTLTPGETASLYEQACRQSWRSLVLIIKAKLEGIASGIVTFEQEFLAHLVLPGGKTIGEYVVPNLDALVSGSTRLLPQGPESPVAEVQGEVVE